MLIIELKECPLTQESSHVDFVSAEEATAIAKLCPSVSPTSNSSAQLIHKNWGLLDLIFTKASGMCLGLINRCLLQNLSWELYISFLYSMNISFMFCKSVVVQMCMSRRSTYFINYTALKSCTLYTNSPRISL